MPVVRSLLESKTEVSYDFSHYSETAEDGWIVAECPALPGCVSQGKDEEEAINNIREAITAWMWAEDQKAIKSLPENQTSLLVAV
jgi:predicted RNase H-like HicB family nuclease